MIGRLARLWKLEEPTSYQERFQADEITREQQQFAHDQAERHKFHRQNNHFADRISEAFKEDARWT